MAGYPTSSLLSRSCPIWFPYFPLYGTTFECASKLTLSILHFQATGFLQARWSRRIYTWLVSCILSIESKYILNSKTLFYTLWNFSWFQHRNIYVYKKMHISLNRTVIFCFNCVHSRCAVYLWIPTHKSTNNSKCNSHNICSLHPALFTYSTHTTRICNYSSAYTIHFGNFSVTRRFAAWNAKLKK